MDKRQLIELYRYDEWANLKLLNAVSQLEDGDFIRDLSSSYKSLRDTMVHIIGVEGLWLSRWMGEQGRALLNADDFPTSNSLVLRWGDFTTEINSFLSSLTEEDLAIELNFTNIKGISYSLELWKQMLHVTNHSSYHRGQVVTMLRQLEKQPPSLDLIYYYLGLR